MWSASTWVTISSSKWRSFAGSPSTRVRSPLGHDDSVPPSTRMRRGLAAPPYSIHSASPCAAGSMSIRSMRLRLDRGFDWREAPPAVSAPRVGEWLLATERVVEAAAVDSQRDAREVDQRRQRHQPLGLPRDLSEQLWCHAWRLLRLVVL